MQPPPAVAKPQPRPQMDVVPIPEFMWCQRSDKVYVTIKVSDRGGGIPRSEVGLLWTYMHTTAEESREDEFLQERSVMPRVSVHFVRCPSHRYYCSIFQ